MPISKFIVMNEYNFVINEIHYSKTDTIGTNTRAISFKTHSKFLRLISLVQKTIICYFELPNKSAVINLYKMISRKQKIHDIKKNNSGYQPHRILKVLVNRIN